MKFQALIDSVHIDPKKGSVKITLVAASHVSLDELTTLSPKEETIHVTLNSKQTKIDVFPLAPNVGDPITLDEEAATKLKEASEKLRDSEEEGKITTEFLTPEASGEEGE